MKAYVFSDSHGNIVKIAQILKNDPPDIALHLGDLASDAERLGVMFPSLPFKYVLGNSDRWAARAPKKLVFDFEGFQIFMTHGHEYLVKNTLTMLVAAAKKTGADCAFFGHTHAPEQGVIDGVRCLNPGSCALPRAGAPTYGVLTAPAGRLEFKIVEIR